MRALRLARVAAEAEALLLRRQARQAVVRALLAALALIFVGAALAMLHVAAWLRLAPLWGPAGAAAALAGGDLVVAALIAWAALRPLRDPVMTEAAALRDRAVGEIRTSLAPPKLLKPLLMLAIDLLLARRAARKD